MQGNTSKKTYENILGSKGKKGSTGITHGYALEHPLSANHAKASLTNPLTDSNLCLIHQCYFHIKKINLNLSLPILHVISDLV